MTNYAPTQLNLEKIFGIEKFEKLISEKLNTIENIEELIHRRVFADQVKKIISKYPFTYLPYFVHDFIHGAKSNELLKKYHISNHMELKEITENILKFFGYRYRLSEEYNAFVLNLRIPTWQEKYELIKDNCNFFKKELLELLFYNMIRSHIIIILNDYVDSGVELDDIISKSNTMSNDLDVFHFVDNQLQNSFNEFFVANYKTVVTEIVTDLIREGVLKRKRSDPKMLIGEFSIDIIKRSIIDELRFDSSKTNLNSINKKLLRNYPSLKLIPGLGMWETAIRELVNEKIIHVETKTNFLNDGLIHLNAEYQKIQQRMKHLDAAQMEFYGRKISPKNFITELIELEKGDFNDKDDQVTRIAGLVLAESAKLQSPHENILDYDFSINITDYHFRPEQLEIISKLNFTINSEIFHCKIMINDRLTLATYNKLKKTLPEDEQGVVITFQKISQEIRDEIAKDHKIQVIDEEGIRAWVSITSVIPSRKHSIVKLYFDPLSKLKQKIVKINHIDYETGLASVTILPQMYESTVLIRSLEEIPLYNSDPHVFETSSADYMEFLKILSSLTRESDFISGMFDQNILSSFMDLNSKLSLKFVHNESFLNCRGLNKKTIVFCNCFRWAEDKLRLCPHLVSAFDYHYRMYQYDLKKPLEYLIVDNVSMILDRLGIELNHKTDEIHGDERITEFIKLISKIKENS